MVYWCSDFRAQIWKRYCTSYRKQIDTLRSHLCYTRINFLGDSMLFARVKWLRVMVYHSAWSSRDQSTKALSRNNVTAQSTICKKFLSMYLWHVKLYSHHTLTWNWSSGLVFSNMFGSKSKHESIASDACFIWLTNQQKYYEPYLGGENNCLLTKRGTNPIFPYRVALGFVLWSVLSKVDMRVEVDSIMTWLQT